jgi:hypothetical protein
MVMGLEVATYIGQLVATNPVPADPVSQGDDHLTLIKRVLQSQFTALGNAPVVRTAAQLNAVTSKLISFNGRTVTAAVPEDDDYSLDMLSDVVITTPVADQVLLYNGAQWENVGAGTALKTGCFLYDTYAGRVTDSIYFTNQRRQTVPASVATFKNSGASGIGWTLTAVTACMVQLNMQLGNQGNTSAPATAFGITFSPSAPSATIPGASNNRLAYALTDQFSADDRVNSISASTVLGIGDVLTVYYTGPTGAAVVTLSGSVIAL